MCGAIVARDHEQRLRGLTGRGMKQMVAAVLAVMLAGCQTIIHGVTEEVGFSTAPPGATISVSNGDQVTLIVY